MGVESWTTQRNLQGCEEPNGSEISLSVAAAILARQESSGTQDDESKQTPEDQPSQQKD